MGKTSSNTSAKKGASKPSSSKPTKTAKVEKAQAKKPATETIVKETAPPRVKLGRGGQNVVNLALDKIKVKDGFNPRQALGDLSALKQQIQKYGMLSSVVVCPISEGSDEYWLIAGHRRFAIAQDLKFDVIIATIRTDITIEDSAALEMALSENDEAGRSNLSALDYAAGVKRLVDMNPERSLRDIAKMCKVSDATISRAMKLLDAPQKVLDMVEAQTLAKGTAVAVVEVDPSIREQVASLVRPGHSEGDVKRMANEVMRKVEADKQQRAAAGKPVEDKPAETFTRPSQKASGEVMKARRDRAAATGHVMGAPSWRTPKEMRAQMVITGTKVLNCRDVNGKAVPEQAEEHAAQLNQYAALLWANGAIQEIDITDPILEQNLGLISEQAEKDEAGDTKTKDKPAKAKAKEAPKAKDKPKPKAKAKAPAKSKTASKTKDKPAKEAKEPAGIPDDESGDTGQEDAPMSAAAALGSVED